jgi:superfamily I DNA and/or RNA helicase
MSLPAYNEVTMRGISSVFLTFLSNEITELLHASVTKLLKNFRSHEAILAFPNEQFYRNELVACASPNITDSLLNWPGLASSKFPIIFEAIAGRSFQ